MRTTVDINADLLERLRQQANELGIPFKDALNQAITRGLTSPRSAPRTPYKMPTFPLGLEESLDIARINQILADEDTESFMRKFYRDQESKP